MSILLAKPGIMIGTIFVLTLAMGDLITVPFMSGSQSANVGRLISNDVGLLQYPHAATKSIVLLCTVLIIVAGLLRLVDLRKGLSWNNVPGPFTSSPHSLACMCCF